MLRGLPRALGVTVVMMSMLMGLGGRLDAASSAGESTMVLAARPVPQVTDVSEDVTYQLREASDGSMVVSALSSELTVNKTIYPDGRTETTLERGRDRVTLVTTTAAITVSRGASTVTIDVHAVTEEHLVRVRTIWGASQALRAFRALAASIEEGASLAPERLSLRITGALVAQLDGDEGAVRRLAKSLRLQAAGPERRVRAATVDCWSIYANGVVHAAADLERCYAMFSIWDPRRNACSFVWTLQVEGCWFGYLSCSSVPLK